MNASPHRRILASAGTGKTWQLTTQWLALLLRSPEQRPESILATTFTRAAAGEIRERILRRLAIAALRGEAGEAERRDIGGVEGMDLPPISAEICGGTLRRLIDRLDRLQIRTLDSFFFSLATGSAFELALPLPIEPLDEHGTSRLVREAIDEAIESFGTGDPEGLLAVLDALTDGYPGRSVADLVERSCKDLVALVPEAPESAWNWGDELLGEEPPPIDVGAVVASLEGFLRRLEDDRRLGDGHVRNAVRSDVARLRTLAGVAEHQIPLDAWVDLLDKGAAGAVASKGGVYRNKPLAEELVALLGPVGARARWRLSKIAVFRTRAAAGLAHHLDAARRAIMARHGAVTYDSVTAVVGAHLAAHPLGELLRRVDARVEHLLLDEFQDTSHGQWSALRPLASEVAACGDGTRRFFAVGDLKQSIYGWRGGDPEILEHLGDRFDAGRGGVEFKEEHLDLSRRSTQEVLDAVNRVFGSIGGNEVLGRASAAAAEWWGRVFGAHRAHRKDSGQAALILVEPDESETETGDSTEGDADASVAVGISAKARAVVDLVVELRNRHPEGRVGIVVRRNRKVAELLAALRSHGISASGWGGGSLRDSAAVNAVLEFLRFCDQPDHTIAAFHVAKSPLGPVVGLSWPASIQQREIVAARWRARLATRGFAAVLESLGRAIAADCSEGDRRRWRRLLDEAERLDRDVVPRPLAFVEAVEAVRIGDGSNAPVTVLNIHQSKGLEFESVICPDLEFDLKPRADVLVSRDDDGGILRIVRRMKGLDHLPPLAEVRDEADAMQVRETLCGLYVALTRARDRLFMVVDAPKATEKSIPMTAAGIVRSAIAPDATGAGVAWSAGELEPEGPTKGPEKPSTPRAPRRRCFAFSGDGGRTRPAPPPSRHATDSLASLLRVDARSSDAADRGTAIHAMFEQIEFFEGEAPENALLDGVLRRVLPRRPASWRGERVDEFRAMLSVPAVAAALARPTEGPARVWRERRFVAVDGGAVRQGVIDRLVVVGEPGAWRRAKILDFKTDAFDHATPVEDAVAAKVEEYRRQLGDYRKEVSKQFGLESGTVETVLLFLDPGIAQPIDAT